MNTFIEFIISSFNFHVFSFSRTSSLMNDHKGMSKHDE